MHMALLIWVEWVDINLINILRSAVYKIKDPSCIMQEGSLFLFVYNFTVVYQ
jgi:hypothetical protein